MLPILSKLPFLHTILSEDTCHRHWRGDKKHLVKVGPEASLWGVGDPRDQSTLGDTVLAQVLSGGPLGMCGPCL